MKGIIIPYDLVSTCTVRCVIRRNFSRVEPLNTGLPNVCRLRVCAVGEFPLIHVYLNPASGFKQLLDELDQQKNCPTVSFQKMK